MRQALEEVKELVRLEVKLAREEVREDVVRLKTVAVLAVCVAVLALVAISTLVLALVLALGGGAGVALVVAAALLLLTGGLAAAAYKAFPGAPLGRTRQRLSADMKQIKEHVS